MSNRTERRIETQEQKDKALKWMVDMAEHPLQPLLNDPKKAAAYRITEKAVQDWNERTIPTLYEDLEPEPVEPEPIKEEPPAEVKAGWLD